VDAGQEILFFAAVEAHALEEVEVLATIEPPAGRDDRQVLGDGQDDGCRPPSDGERDSTRTVSTVLDGPHLVLPYFEVDRDAAGAATLFSVRSLAGDPIGLRIDYYSAAGLPLGFEEGEVLGPKAVRTVHLRDVLGSVPGAFGSGPGPVTGYAWITAADPLAGEPSPQAPGDPALHGRGLGATPPAPARLAGDFFQLGPEPGTAHGGLLLSVDPGSGPADRCGEWSVRFTEEEPFDGGTDFVVWVTGDLDTEPPELPEPPRLLTGIVYDPAGQEQDQAISIPLPVPQAAFAVREPLVDDQALPTAGTIEWTFPEGLVGNVAAVQVSTAGFSVRVPGVCRDRPGADRPLVLPYFEVDPAEGGVTTLLAVRNEGDGEVAVVFDYFGTDGTGPVFQETCTLPRRGLRTVDLRELGLAQEAGCTAAGDPSGLTTGFVEVRTPELEPPSPEGGGAPDGGGAPAVFLRGDYARIDPASRQAAGAALLDSDPAALCRRWSTRVLHGGGLGTDFIVYAPPEGDGSGSLPAATWTLRDAQGRCVAGDEEPCPAVELELQGVASQVTSGDLLAELAELPGPGDLGSMEWDLLDRRGHVSTRFRADLGDGKEFSILVPGVCLDEPDPPDEPEPDP